MKIARCLLFAIPASLIGLLVFSTIATQVYLHFAWYPPAISPPDWSVLGEEQIPVVVTSDPDGDRRTTQVWIAVVDGNPYLRTSDTRWYANIIREPQLELWIGGYAYSCAATELIDEGFNQTVHDAFFAKYPRRSRMFRAMGIRTTRVLALECGVDIQ